MNIEIMETEISVKVRFNDRFTFDDRTDFHEVLTTIQNSERDSVEFDFDRLQFIDSAALGMLMIAQDAFAKSGKSFAISNAHAQVRRVLEITEFDKVLKIEA